MYMYEYIYKGKYIYIYINIEEFQGGMVGKQTISCPIKEAELAVANEGQCPCSRRENSAGCAA